MRKMYKRLIILSFIILGLSFNAWAIDLDIIAKIESNYNTLAYNFNSGARGLYQITPICLEEYNRFHEKKVEPAELFNPRINEEVAIWYLGERIPQMLNHYGYKATDKAIIICYNAGISYIVKGLSLPEKTKNYIKKYKLLKLKKLEKEKK